RIELSTSPLPRECSTTELRQHCVSQIHDAPANDKPGGVSGGERDAERGDVRLDAGGEDADFAQVPDEAGVQVAAEVFAERGLVAASCPFAAKALDLFDLGSVEPHIFIG